MSVLFLSIRPLNRAENIKAVYEAYDGDKQFILRRLGEPLPDLSPFSVMVTDELVNESPGKYIFIGHGAGAGKTYGLDQPRPYFYRSELITYAIASSQNMVPHVARQLGIPKDKVVPLGFPRMDYYTKSTREPFYLFAPTFRAWPYQLDWNELHKHIPEGARLIVKPHMIQPDIIRSVWQGIETADAMEPSADYLMRMSALVTDYSSIMFDAMVMRKPYVLFAKDREMYLKSRGMYYLYPQDYGPFYCEHEADLFPLLEKAEWNDECETARQFYVGACDGHSTERTVELIRRCL